MSYNETLKYARSEARKLGLTFLDNSKTPRCEIKCFRFIKRGKTRGKCATTIVRVLSLEEAIELINSGELSNIVNRLKYKDLF